jgi:hypothetical protein
MALKNAPFPYPPCSGSDGDWHHLPHDGSVGGIDCGNCSRDDDNTHSRKKLTVRLHQRQYFGGNPYWPL